MSFKIELSETQYNKIIKFALSEEKKKTLLNEGASSMVMSDLKNKIQARMKGSLKIGPKLKNYPTAIDIIGYSNGRSLTFFDNGVVKWYDGKNFTKGGKWDYNMTKEGKLAGGWLKNDKGVNISLDDAINYPAKNYGTGAGPLVTKTSGSSSSVCDKCKNDPLYYAKNLVTCRNCGLDELLYDRPGQSIWVDLGQKLNSYKPKTTTYFENKDAHVVEYLGSKPQDKKQLVFKKDGTIWFTDKPGSVKNNGAKWDKRSSVDGKLSGGWLTNNQGKKVSLGDALSEPQFNFGSVPKRAVDELILGSYDLTEYINRDPEGKKYVEDMKTACGYYNTTPRRALVKSDYLCLLEKKPPTKMIAAALLQSKGYILDEESLAEAAFLGIKTLDRYNQVKYYIGEDPYIYVSKYMEVQTKFYKQAIHKSYERIIQSTTSKKDESLGCKNVILTATRPAGPKHNENYKDLISLIGQGYFKNENQNTIPSDFGWNKNNNIYPKPIIYTIKEIESCQKIVDTYPKDNSQKPRREITKSGAVITKPGLVDIRLRPADAAENINNLSEIKTFNFDLLQQSRLIPKYCKKQWSKTYNYYDEEKIKNPNNRNPVTGVYDVDKTKTFSIPYSKLCEDFGGLWVFNGSTSSPECFCRDYSHPYLNLDMEIKPFKQGGYVIKSKDEKLNFKKENKKGINWSHDDSKAAAAKVIGFIGAVFAPTFLGQLIAAGVNLGVANYYYKKGDYKNAAIEAFFAVLGPLNKIPAVAKFWKTELLIPMKRSLIDNGVLTKKQADWWVKLLGLETILSKNIGIELEKRLGKEALKTYTWKTAFNAIKEIEKKIAEQMGLTKKGIAKVASDL